MGPRQFFFSNFLLILFDCFSGCELFWKGEAKSRFRERHTDFTPVIAAPPKLQESGECLHVIYSGLTQARLQVCCNVSKVLIWPLGKDFVVGEKAIDQAFPDPQDDMWAELQLSICSDRREATIGWVIGRPGITCDHKTGQTMTLSSASLPLPGWYVICYTLNGGCQTCSIETLCSNDLSEACSDVSVLGSSPSATNSTINYWTKVGKNFPFPASASSIELTVEGTRDRKEAAKKTIPLKIGAKSDVVLNGLSENEIYTVRRCIVIDLPQSLMTDQRFKFYSKKNKICVEEGYRTERSSSSFRVVPTILCLLFIFFL